MITTSTQQYSGQYGYGGGQQRSTYRVEFGDLINTPDVSVQRRWNASLDLIT